LKLPLSVLVVVHTPEMEVLLLERVQRPGFWQSVTGSLDRPDEPLEAAAARELREETGLVPSSGRLRRWNVAYTFEIYAQWRHRFAPGVTHNTEHLFSFELERAAPVTIAPEEHTASAWLPWREAARKCFSWSNRDAILMVGAALLAAGCASAPAPLAPHLQAGAPEVQECARWYQALDAEIDAAGVRDAQDARMAGFPHLRVDRLLAGLQDRALTSEAAMRAYGEWLAELDLEARAIEIRNLPTLQTEAAREQSRRRAQDCSRVLRQADLASPAARKAMLEAARLPPDWAPARAVGEVTTPTLDPGDGVQRVRYAPPAGQRLPRGVVSGLLGRATFDPLGYLALTAREIERLAITYAPSFEIETRADYDRFGWLRWRRNVPMPQVEATEPTVYVQAAYVRDGELLLLQLVYTLWFPERHARDNFDPGAGPLDGVVWRVTLAPDGEPLVYDSIHACGCLPVVFPSPRVAENERPVVTLASATHDVQGLRMTSDSESLVRYVLRPYAELRSLPLMAGGHASMFRPDGRVAGSAARQAGRYPDSLAQRFERKR
jgi:8-oxo-dGTP pyrophosphatase MutT (NUDIX family)